jgi:hypothetical protein
VCVCVCVCVCVVVAEIEAPTAWVPELGPCSNEDAAGKCGKNHLHNDCPKRAAATAAAAAKKKWLLAHRLRAYVAGLHNDEDDPVIFVGRSLLLAAPPGGRGHGQLRYRRRRRLHRPGASALRVTWWC